MAFVSQHRRFLQRDYPPVGNVQRKILADYTAAIRELAAELRKPDRAVNPETLNRADAGARWLVMEYWRLINEKK